VRKEKLGTEPMQTSDGTARIGIPIPENANVSRSVRLDRASVDHGSPEPRTAVRDVLDGADDPGAEFPGNACSKESSGRVVVRRDVYGSSAPIELLADSSRGSQSHKITIAIAIRRESRSHQAEPVRPS
jgi:hypothetical protein